MSPVVYTPRMKVMHAFGGTFPVIEKVILSFFIIMLSITVIIFRKNEVPIRNFCLCLPPVGDSIIRFAAAQHITWCLSSLDKLGCMWAIAVLTSVRRCDNCCTLDSPFINLFIDGLRGLLLYYIIRLAYYCTIYWQVSSQCYQDSWCNFW